MKITLNDFYAIQKTSSECTNIWEWKRKLKEYAVQFELEDRVVIAIAHSYKLPFEERKKLIGICCTDEVDDE